MLSNDFIIESVSTKGDECSPVEQRLILLEVHDHTYIVWKIQSVLLEIIDYTANMGVLNIYHPDIEDFVLAKSKDANALKHFNLSVMVDDDFMLAMTHDENIYLHWPVYDSDGNIIKDESQWKIKKKVKATELWDLIIKNAYDNGEPGIFFYDTMNHTNNLNYTERIICSNPCSEYLSGVIFDGSKPPESYGGACNLGSLMLHRFVKNPFTPRAEFEYGKLRDTIKIAVRFLDNIIDKNTYPDEIYENYQKSFRTIGLGVTGLADMLVMMNLKYNSKEGRKFVDKLFGYISLNAYQFSIELAKEKGEFPEFSRAFGENSDILNADVFAWQQVKKDIHTYGIRNGKLLSIAPTGTMSLVFGNNCSSGIEPIFSLKYNRDIKVGGQSEDKKQTYEMRDYAYDLYLKLKEKGNVEDLNPNPPFVTALEMDVNDHIDMLAVIAKHVDMSVSKTINVPTEYTFEQCKDIYYNCWMASIKGCTIFRPNALRPGILSAPKGNNERGNVISCDDSLLGIKRKLMTGCGSLHLMAWYNSSGKIMEVFTGRGSSGGCEKNLTAMARLISLNLRGGVPLEKVIDQLESSGGCSAYQSRRVSKGDTSKGSSCASAIAIALKDMQREIDKRVGSQKLKDLLKKPEEPKELPKSGNTPKCPECGEPLTFEGGCNVCKSCGWSKCG